MEQPAKTGFSSSSGQRFYHWFIEHVRDYAIIFLDVDGAILSWNAGATVLFGFTPEEAIGQFIDIIFTESDIEAGRPRRELIETARNGSSLDHRWHVRKDGSRFYCLGNTIAVRDSCGAHFGYCKIAQDFTEHMHDDIQREHTRASTEQRLVHLESLLRDMPHNRSESVARLQQQSLELAEQAELIELSHDAFIVRDLNGRILHWNHGATELYGWTREEALGRISHELLRTDLQKMDEVELSLLTRMRWEGELLHRRKDGERVYVLSRWIIQLPSAQHDVRVLEINTDITAQKLAEQSKIEFLTQMSHELRTPLNAIIGFADLLLGEEETRTLTPDLRRNFLRHVHSAGLNLLGLVQDLLDLNLSESGRLELHREPVDVRGTLASVVRVLEPRAEEREVEVEIRETEALDVYADPNRLMQILYNLVGQAVRHASAHVWIGYGGNERRAFVSISDDGPPLSEEQRTRLFRPFEQVRPNQPSEEGLLDALIARQLVEAHGGVLELLSAEEKGNTFVISLPCPDRSPHA